MTMEHTKTVKGNQIELRIRAGTADMLVIISAKGGWNYKQEFDSAHAPKNAPLWRHPTDKYNVRLSMNGVAMLTYDQWVGVDQLINSTLAIATLEAARAKAGRPTDN